MDDLKGKGMLKSFVNENVKYHCTFIKLFD